MTILGLWRLMLQKISIHTALAGCDKKGLLEFGETVISIHTALAGCDERGLCGFGESVSLVDTALAGCDGIGYSFY